MIDLDVVKDNTLVDMRTDCPIGTFEYQFINACVARVSMKDEVLKHSTMNIDKLYKNVRSVDLTGTTRINIYSRLERLANTRIKLHSEDGTFVAKWFDYVRHIEGTSKVEYKLSDTLSPYLLNLKDSFTLIKRSVYMKMGSWYTMRLIELMGRLHGPQKTRRFSIDELKGKMGISDRYSRTYDLKRYVIQPTIEEINILTDWHMSYEIIKVGRKVVAIKFIREVK